MKTDDWKRFITGENVKPARKSDKQLILDHIREVCCGGDQERFEAVLKFFGQLAKA